MEQIWTYGDADFQRIPIWPESGAMFHNKNYKWETIIQSRWTAYNC